MAARQTHIAPPEPAVVRFRPPRRQRHRDRRLTLSLTPMIDVTFQLLLFFLLTMQFKAAEGQIPAGLPRQGGDFAAPTVRLEPIVIRLTRDPFAPRGVQIHLDRQGEVLTDFNDLFAALTAIQRLEGPGVPVLVAPDDRVSWEAALDAYYQAVRANYKTIAFAQPGGGGS